MPHAEQGAGSEAGATSIVAEAAAAQLGVSHRSVGARSSFQQKQSIAPSHEALASVEAALAALEAFECAPRPPLSPLPSDEPPASPAAVPLRLKTEPVLLVPASPETPDAWLDMAPILASPAAVAPAPSPEPPAAAGKSPQSESPVLAQRSDTLSESNLRQPLTDVGYEGWLEAPAASPEGSEAAADVELEEGVRADLGSPQLAPPAETPSPSLEPARREVAQGPSDPPPSLRQPSLSIVACGPNRVRLSLFCGRAEEEPCHCQAGASSEGADQGSELENGVAIGAGASAGGAAEAAAFAAAAARLPAREGGVTAGAGRPSATGAAEVAALTTAADRPAAATDARPAASPVAADGSRVCTAPLPCATDEPRFAARSTAGSPRNEPREDAQRQMDRIGGAAAVALGSRAVAMSSSVTQRLDPIAAAGGSGVVAAPGAAAQQLDPFSAVGGAGVAPTCSAAAQGLDPIGAAAAIARGAGVIPTCFATAQGLDPIGAAAAIARGAGVISTCVAVVQPLEPIGAAAAVRATRAVGATSVAGTAVAPAAVSASRRSSDGELLLVVGDRVRTAFGDLGTVRFLGPTSFRAGEWVGVELDCPKGKNDGAVAGVAYFHCRMRHGLFTRPENLVVVAPASFAPGSASTAAGGLAVDGPSPRGSPSRPRTLRRAWVSSPNARTLLPPAFAAAAAECSSAAQAHSANPLRARYSDSPFLKRSSLHAEAYSPYPTHVVPDGWQAAWQAAPCSKTDTGWGYLPPGRLPVRVYVTSTPTERKVAADCRRVIDLLAAKRVPFDIFDLAADRVGRGGMSIDRSALLGLLKSERLPRVQIGEEERGQTLDAGSLQDLEDFGELDTMLRPLLSRFGLG